MPRYLKTPQEIGRYWPEERERRVTATVLTAGQRAGRAEGMMKGGARWSDRTSAARGGLKAGVDVGLGGSGAAFGFFAVTGGLKTRVRRIVLYLQHGVEYGKWLETLGGAAMGYRARIPTADLARPEYAGKKYAIIHPTARRIAPSLKAAVRRIWSGGGDLVR